MSSWRPCYCGPCDASRFNGWAGRLEGTSVPTERNRAVRHGIAFEVVEGLTGRPFNAATVTLCRVVSDAVERTREAALSLRALAVEALARPASECVLARRREKARKAKANANRRRAIHAA